MLTSVKRINYSSQNQHRRLHVWWIIMEVTQQKKITEQPERETDSRFYIPMKEGNEKN